METVEGFKEGLEGQIPLLLKIQALDETGAKAFVELGKLYDSRWGTWHWDDSAQKVVFSTEEDDTIYRQLCGKIASAGEQEKALQKELRRKAAAGPS